MQCHAYMHQGMQQHGESQLPLSLLSLSSLESWRVLSFLSVRIFRFHNNSIKVMISMHMARRVTVTASIAYRIDLADEST